MFVDLSVAELEALDHLIFENKDQYSYDDREMYQAILEKLQVARGEAKKFEALLREVLMVAVDEMKGE